ncbi:MAG: DMT family transporter [Pseudomonadota bacterium]
MFSISRYGRAGPLRGVAAITLAVFLLSLSDALVKLAGERFGLAQLILLRSLVAGALIGGSIVWLAGRRALRPRRPGWVWMRSLSLTAMWLSYFASLPSLSFALAAACYYTSPVWMALMARLGFGERIGLRGWGAIALSSLGVVLVVDPLGESAVPAMLLPLAAAMFYALAATITWQCCRGEEAGAMAFNLNLCLAVVASVALGLIVLMDPAEPDSFVFVTWRAMGVQETALIALFGVLLAVISTLVAFAYRSAPSPVVGVVDTGYLAFAILWSLLIFAETPTYAEAVGIALIGLGAAIMTLRTG